MLGSSVWWRRFVSVESYFTFALLLFVLAFMALPSSKAVNNFYYSFIALPALWILVRGRWKMSRSTPLFWLWIALLLWMLLAAVQIQTFQYLKHWLYVAVFCGITLLLADYCFFRRDRVMQWLFYAVLAYVVLSTLYLWRSGLYQPGQRIHMPMRLTSPTYASIVLVAFFALTISRLIKCRNWGGLGLSATLVFFATGYVLQSRAGVLGLFVVIGLASVYTLWSARRGWIRLLLVLVGLSTVVGLWYLFENVPTFERLIDRADSGRFELWHAHYQLFLDCRTWLGCVPTHFDAITISGGRVLIEHPHNVMFSMLLYYGWVGLLLFVLILSFSFLEAWRQNNPWGLFLLASLLMLMFDGGGLINQPNELWLLILLPCMLILAEQVRQPESVEYAGADEGR